MGYTEIAGEVRVTENTSVSGLTRAMRRLRTMVGT